EPSVTSSDRGIFGRSPKFPLVSGQGCPHLPARDRALQQPTKLLRARVAFGYDGGLRAFVPGHAYSGLCTGQGQGRQEKVGVGPLECRTRHHQWYPPLHMRPTKRRTQRFCVVRHRTSQGASGVYGHVTRTPRRPDVQSLTYPVRAAVSARLFTVGVEGPHGLRGVRRDSVAHDDADDPCVQDLAIAPPPAGALEPPMPAPDPSVMLLRSVKTHRSRRSAAELWQDHNLVFCTRTGTPPARHNVLRELHTIMRKAGPNDKGWTTRELRHMRHRKGPTEWWTPRCTAASVSGRRDLNPRPLDPQSSALPNCATSRDRRAHNRLRFLPTGTTVSHFRPHSNTKGRVRGAPAAASSPVGLTDALTECFELVHEAAVLPADGHVRVGGPGLDGDVGGCVHPFGGLGGDPHRGQFLTRGAVHVDPRLAVHGLVDVPLGIDRVGVDPARATVEMDTRVGGFHLGSVLVEGKVVDPVRGVLTDPQSRVILVEGDPVRCGELFGQDDRLRALPVDPDHPALWFPEGVGVAGGIADVHVPG